jgi:negative regulator of flagellin synthesis FlgM
MVSEVNGQSNGISLAPDTRVRSIKDAASVRAKSNIEDIAPGSADKVSLTEMASKLQSLERSLTDVPQVDKKRVESIKEAIDNGSYQVNAGRVAEKLIQFESMPIAHKANS